MNTISQILIMLLGCSAIWLVGRKENWRRWGFIAGFLAQPFWMYTTIHNHQWGILAMTFFYTFSWMQGIYNYWIKENIRINAIACALWYSILPWGLYEKECHYKEMSYWRHLTLNLQYAWRWLTFSETADDIAFEEKANGS
jgi:hypothetical protein